MADNRITKHTKPSKEGGQWWYGSYKHPRIGDETMKSHGPFKSREEAETHQKSQKSKSIKEDAPTNCMGMSSSTTGPITTYDPLLKKKKRGKLEPLSVFSRKKKEESGGSN